MTAFAISVDGFTVSIDGAQTQFSRLTHPDGRAFVFASRSWPKVLAALTDPAALWVRWCELLEASKRPS